MMPRPRIVGNRLAEGGSTSAVIWRRALRPLRSENQEKQSNKKNYFQPARDPEIDGTHSRQLNEKAIQRQKKRAENPYANKISKTYRPEVRNLNSSHGMTGKLHIPFPQSRTRPSY